MPGGGCDLRQADDSQIYQGKQPDDLNAPNLLLSLRVTGRIVNMDTHRCVRHRVGEVRQYIQNPSGFVASISENPP